MPCFAIWIQVHSIPAPGTENDDHNPPRIAPRSLFDVSVGDDNIFHGDRYKWSFRVSAVNLTNKVRSTTSFPHSAARITSRRAQSVLWLRSTSNHWPHYYQPRGNCK